MLSLVGEDIKNLIKTFTRTGSRYDVKTRNVMWAGITRSFNLKHSRTCTGTRARWSAKPLYLLSINLLGHFVYFIYHLKNGYYDYLPDSPIESFPKGVTFFAISAGCIGHPSEKKIIVRHGTSSPKQIHHRLHNCRSARLVFDSFVHSRCRRNKEKSGQEERASSKFIHHWKSFISRKVYFFPVRLTLN